MLNNITNFFNLVSARRIKTSVGPTDLVALGVQDPRTPGIYQPAAIRACDLGGGGVEIFGTGGTGSTVRSGVGNTASGYYSAALGGQNNTAGGTHTFVGGGFFNCAVGCAGTVAGGIENFAGIGSNTSCCCLLGSTGVGGIGVDELLQSCYSTVGGGYGNQSFGLASFVGGGMCNSASGTHNGILAGQCNSTAGFTNAMIVGSNITADRNDTTFVNALSIKSFASNYGSSLCVGANGLIETSSGGSSIMVIGGPPNSTMRCGTGNSANGFGSGSLSGDFNNALAANSIISGGIYNTANGRISTISGGCCNTTSNYGSTISGGYFNTATGNYSTVSGGLCNIASEYNSIISGGLKNNNTTPFSVIGGGNCNNICNSSGCTNGAAMTIAGGIGNGTCGGAFDSLSCSWVNPPIPVSSGLFSFIGGGFQNRVQSAQSTVSGGYCNNVACFSNNSTIGGGLFNTINVQSSSIGGGRSNTSSGGYSVIAGGWSNSTSGNMTSIAGGRSNTASGGYTGILGGCSNIASSCKSFIVGSNITTNRDCTTFVNNLNIMNIPTAAAGLPTKSVWFDSATCTLKMVP